MRHISFTLLFIFAGCATTHFSESVNPDTGAITTTYTGRSIVPPFGKGPDSVHTLGYEYEGNTIAIGQAAQGLDATNQSAALKTLADLLKEIYMIQFTQPPSVEEVSP